MAAGWDTASSKGKMSIIYMVLLTEVELHLYSVTFVSLALKEKTTSFPFAPV